MPQVEKGGQSNALGRPRGGFGAKIHALVDANGIPRQFFLTPGNSHDAPIAEKLLKDFPLDGRHFLGDRDYDSDKIIDLVQGTSGIAVIPSRSNRLQQRDYDKELYKLRNVDERFFNRLKQFLRIATRYEKLALLSSQSFILPLPELPFRDFRTRPKLPCLNKIKD